MGGVSPETCWASYKYEIKFWYTVASCWIFFMNYTAMHGSTNIRDKSSTLVEVYRRYVILYICTRLYTVMWQKAAILYTYYEWRHVCSTANNDKTAVFNLPAINMCLVFFLYSDSALFLFLLIWFLNCFITYVIVIVNCIYLLIQSSYMAPLPTGYRTCQNLCDINMAQYLRIKYNTCQSLEINNIHTDNWYISTLEESKLK